jgi:ribosomal protein L11 methylase PrmA
MSQNFVYKNKVGTVNDPRGYAINWIKQFSPDQPVNIFDVGCACGDLGIAIRENNIVGEIWGLEYDIESVNYAKKLNVYNDILHVDLNNFKSENNEIIIDEYTFTAKLESLEINKKVKSKLWMR